MTEKQRKFYHSKRWLDFRQVVIGERLDENGQSICEYCGKPIVKPYDLIIHHKTELTDDNVTDAEIALNPENVQIVHFKCHNRIHERWCENAATRFKPVIHHVYLVWGPPLAGKSTWVRETMNPGDLVVDLDSIWQAISEQHRYHKPAQLKGTVFDLRDWLYDRIKHRAGNWVDAYVIAGAPRVGDRERLKVRIAADRDVFISAEEQTCYERALDRCTDKETGQLNGEMFNEQAAYTKTWFERYQPDIPEE